MKTIISSALVGTLGLGIAFSVAAGPVEDQIAFQKYYESRFPNTPTEDFANGVYSILPTAREQWEAIEEFPPYEIAIESGEELYHSKFANGNSLADCFGPEGAVRGQYPFWDKDRGMVVTMTRNGLKASASKTRGRMTSPSSRSPNRTWASTQTS